MKLHNLFPAKGSKHRKKLLGRGYGSGHGKSSTRGGKGQTARAGDASLPPGFAGGQMPLVRRIPKRGFTNAMHRREYIIVNLGILDKKFDSGTQIDHELLFTSGLISKKNLPIKILGDGELTKVFNIIADAFSESAIKKIQSCGGSIEKVK